MSDYIILIFISLIFLMGEFFGIVFFLLIVGMAFWLVFFLFLFIPLWMTIGLIEKFNPKLAAKISKMTPLQAAREIAKVEMKVTKPKQKPKPKESSAPPPPPNVPPGGPIPKKSPTGDRKALHNKWEKKRKERLGVVSA